MFAVYERCDVKGVARMLILIESNELQHSSSVLCVRVYIWLSGEESRTTYGKYDLGVYG